MASIIFYGAGENAKRNLAKWEADGLIPTCFVDLDISKQHTKFRDTEYDILPLIEAVTKYPDYELYLTLIPQNLKSVREALLKLGIPEARLKTCEDVEWRLGCSLLGSYIVITSACVRPCCNMEKGIRIAYPTATHTVEDVRQAISKYKDWLAVTLNHLRKNEHNDCENCSMLTIGYYPKNPKIKSLNVGAGFADTACNCRCIYCNQDTSLDKSLQTLNGYDIHLIAHEEFGDSIEKTTFADGEITVLPHRDKLINLALKNKWVVSICTNALIYNDDIKELLIQGGNMNVSLDSGTKETYERIKGINGFDKVVKNLECYANTGAYIALKYILLPGYNDNRRDINGFIDIALKINAGQVMLSNDIYDLANKRAGNIAETISEDKFETFAYFAARCKEVGLRVVYCADYFTSSDCIRMNAIVR